MGMLQRLHQLLKALLADGVLHAAGVFLSGIRGNARFRQPLGKKVMLGIDLICRRLTGFGQAQIAVRIPGQEPALAQEQ